MWSSEALIEPRQLSRRAFVVSAAAAAGANVLSSPGACEAAPAAPATPKAPTPRWLVSEDPVFSVGATAGELTFVAQDAAGPGELPAGTPAQTERALENLRRALASVGQSPDDLVFLQVLLTDYGAAP
jgi:enamine deaminase RidA (YjgF/YER057c/UK114 family)